MHEAQIHDQNIFVTFTYEDDQLPQYGSLVKDHIFKFFKDLRNSIYPKKIRYFQCGEYGDESQRPHFHAIIFGHDFSDKVLWNVRDNIRLYTSSTLDDIWQRGMCTIGDVTFESAAYVARYVTKKINGELAEEHYMRTCPYTGEIIWLEPEFATMSRRPGIGSKWYDKYKDDVFPHDEVVMNGIAHKPPRFYDTRYEFEDAMKAFEIKNRRLDNINKDENTPERLAIKKAVKEAQLKFLKHTI